MQVSMHVLAMFLNYELFWMNNKAINEFGFCRIWRIKQISEGVIHPSSVDNTLLDLLNSSDPTQPHSLIAKYAYYMFATTRHILQW